MAGPKRTSAQRERGYVEIARLRLRGKTQAEIATRLGVSQPQISHDLKIIEKRWQEAALEDLARAKARELARLDEIERELWDAWERSKADGRRAPHRRADKGAAPEGGQGEPRFIAQLLAVSERRARLLGLDAPSRVGIGQDPSAPPVSIDARTEILSRLAGIAERRRTDAGDPGADG